MRQWKILASSYFILTCIQALGILDRLAYGEWLGKPGDKLTQLLNLIFLAISGLLLASAFPRLATIRSGAGLAFSLVGLFFCSALWSIDPGTSIKQAIEYLFLIFGSIGIALTLDVDDYMHLVGVLVTACAAASLALIVIDPALVYETVDFRGIFGQKNVLGEAMAIGALALLHSLRAGRGRSRRNFAFLLIVAVTAILSKSATACSTIAIFCFTDFVLFLMRKRGGSGRPLAFGLMAAAALLVIVFTVFPDILFGVMGKDSTLTGRTDIWHYVMIDIYQRPLLGWGYLAFWSVDNPAAMDIAYALNWFAPQAHNGLLEILIHVGAVGAALMIFLLVRTIIIAIKCLRTGDSVLAVTCLLSCVGIILTGISETVLIDAFEASTSVFFITGFYCERALRSGRQRRVHRMGRASQQRAALLEVRT